MATKTTRLPPAKRHVIDEVRDLKVGQTLKTDDVLIESARSLVSKVKNQAKNTTREGISFNVNKREGSIYISRVS